MTTNQIYEEYMVPKNLQEHMLRVAALAKLILEKWTGSEVDKEAIVCACTFHDIAKPMNFDLAKQAQFGMSTADIEKLRQLQERLKNQFGTDEHGATVKICEDIGLGSAPVRLVDNLEWKYVPRLLEENDTASLIPIYCDMRIGPKGILTIEERHSELALRENAEGLEERVKNGKILEKLILENTQADLSSVTNDQLFQQFEGLLNLEI